MVTTNRGLTRRDAIKLGASIALIPSVINRASGASVPIRKNIDNLTPDELENYKHAVTILMQRSQINPNVKEGYAWQARLHNDHEREEPDGLARGCEHRSEIFFPWHRAHLAGFEFLLRAADPPRTANVTIPYWDWTMDASGVRFPKAFEDATSPLFHSKRYATPNEVPNNPSLLKVIKWDAGAVRDMVQDGEWSKFAGGALGSPDEGPGRLEQGPHNTIHPSIGQTMGATRTASEDPIYWSFHAYIDLVWARWQKVHVDATHPQPLASPTMKMWTEPFVPTADQTAQTEAMPSGYQYGYDYDFSNDVVPIVVASGPPTSRRSLDHVQKTDRSSRSEALRLTPAKRHLLRVADVIVFVDLTYAINAYVHDPAINVAALSEDQRRQYLADSATIWMSGGHTHKPVTLFLTSQRQSLSTGLTR
jgi:hypothetical protein